MEVLTLSKHEMTQDLFDKPTWGLPPILHTCVNPNLHHNPMGWNTPHIPFKGNQIRKDHEQTTKKILPRPPDISVIWKMLLSRMTQVQSHVPQILLALIVMLASIT